MSKSDISFLWPLTALSFVFATFAAIWFLNEQVSVIRWAGVIFIMIGADPCTTWLHDIGVDLDAKGFVCTHDSFATSIPGLFAVGDVRANSVKRVASAVGEGSVVISAVHAYLASRRTF